MQHLLTLILILVLPAAASAGEYRIVLPPKPSRIVSHAGNELTRYLRQMTGAKVTATENAPGFILGGPECNPAAKALLESGKLTEPKDWTSETNPEAFYLQSTKDGSVVLAGKSDAAILYAVYEYLERYGRCGFFEDGDYIPRRIPPTTGISCTTKPRFLLREFHGDLCGAFGIKKFHFGHRTADDWVLFYDWLAKRRINVSGLYAGINSIWAGDAVEMAFGVKDDATPGERYGAGWPTGWTWPSKVRTRLMQRRIATMHDRGIKIYWYCMYGHTPVPFKNAHPELKWVPSNYEHALLHPDEPLASDLTAKFYQAVVDLYGTDHLYTDTPYCESMGAGNEDEALKVKIAAALECCKVLKSVDPQATWICDSWDFGALPNLWTPERKQKYFRAIPREMTHIFDATTDMNPFYASTNYFDGLTWGVGNLHSFQGDDHLHGDLAALIRTMETAADSPGGNKLISYFNLPEIHGANIIYWQLSTRLAWDPKGVKLEDYLHDFTETRYGEKSYPVMRKAVDDLVRGVYSGQNHQPIYHRMGCGVPFWWPIFEESRHYGGSWLPSLALTIKHQGKAVETALSQETSQKENTLYENDMVDWTKSYLSHMFNYSIISAHRAFRTGDTNEMRKWSRRAYDLLLRIEQILSTRPDFSLQRDINEIMKVPGTNPATPAMMRRQCVNSMYATNDVYEQVHHYYRPRIQTYLRELDARAAKGEKKITWSDVSGECQKIEERWLAGPIEVPASVRFHGSTMDAVRDAFRFARTFEREIVAILEPKTLKGNLSVTCGSPVVENGLSIVPNGDGSGSASDFNGEKCWIIGPGSPEKHPYLYVAADDTRVFNPKDSVELMVEFFDEGTGEAALAYDSHDVTATLNGAYKAIPAIKLTDTRQWRTSTIKMTNPRLTNRQNNGADFRIESPTVTLKIRSLTLRPQLSDKVHRVQ